MRRFACAAGENEAGLMLGKPKRTDGNRTKNRKLSPSASCRGLVLWCNASTDRQQVDPCDPPTNGQKRPPSVSVVCSGYARVAQRTKTVLTSLPHAHARTLSAEPDADANRNDLSTLTRVAKERETTPRASPGA